MSFYESLVHSTQRNYTQNYFLYEEGKTSYELSEKPAVSYEDQIASLAGLIRNADCVVVGAASGLSAAGGGDFYYDDTPSYRKYFGKYSKKYGFKGAFAGMSYPFENREERWGYLATFLHTTQTAEIRKPYLQLDRLLKDKEFFIITTNQDTQFAKLYAENKVAQIQGDHRYFQCSRPCCDEIWDAVKPVEDMIKAMGDDTAVPADLIPRCPHCGAEAFPWVRGYGNFLQGKRYEEEYQKISDYILAHKKERILFLELGVGRMTPMFIQEPFWELTGELKKAGYVSINDTYSFVPKMIENRAMAIMGDISKVLEDTLSGKPENKKTNQKAATA